MEKIFKVRIEFWLWHSGPLKFAEVGKVFFKQKTAYEMLRSLVGSEMCIRDRYQSQIFFRTSNIFSILFELPTIDSAQKI